MSLATVKVYEKCYSIDENLATALSEIHSSLPLVNKMITNTQFDQVQCPFESFIDTLPKKALDAIKRKGIEVECCKLYENDDVEMSEDGTLMKVLNLKANTSYEINTGYAFSVNKGLVMAIFATFDDMEASKKLYAQPVLIDSMDCSPVVLKIVTFGDDIDAVTLRLVVFSAKIDVGNKNQSAIKLKHLVVQSRIYNLQDSTEFEKPVLIVARKFVRFGSDDLITDYLSRFDTVINKSEIAVFSVVAPMNVYSTHVKFVKTFRRDCVKIGINSNFYGFLGKKMKKTLKKYDETLYLINYYKNVASNDARMLNLLNFTGVSCSKNDEIWNKLEKYSKDGPLSLEQIQEETGVICINNSSLDERREKLLMTLRSSIDGVTATSVKRMRTGLE